MASVMLKVVLQDSQLQRKYPLGCFLENFPQFGDFHPSNIPHFVMLRNRFSIFHLAQEDKTNSWEPTLQLLLTAEWNKGEATIILGGINLGTDVGIEARPP